MTRIKRRAGQSSTIICVRPPRVLRRRRPSSAPAKERPRLRESRMWSMLLECLDFQAVQR